MNVSPRQKRQADSLRNMIRTACKDQNFAVYPRVPVVRMDVRLEDWLALDTLLRQVADAELEVTPQQAV